MHGNRVRRLLSIEGAMRDALYQIDSRMEQLRDQKFDEDEWNSLVELTDTIEQGMNALRDALRREQRLVAPKHYLR